MSDLLIKLWQNGILQLGIWETIYMTLISTFFAYLIGLPVGLILRMTDRDGIHPIGWLNRTLGITSILVAHELAAVRQVADRVHLIANGKLVAQGSPDELAREATPWTRQFFGGEADGPVPFHYPAPDYANDLGFGGGATR